MIEDPGQGTETQGTLERPTVATGAARTEAAPRKKGWIVFFVALGIVVVASIAVYRFYFHAPPFEPVQLTAEEQLILDAKLEELAAQAEGADRSRAGEFEKMAKLPPGVDEEEFLEQLSEQRRTLMITEREINAMLNHNTNLEERVRIRFYDDGIGGEAIIPVPEDVPFFGGKTIRAGAAVATYVDLDGKLAIVIEDVSLNGVPLPNAWLGGVKGLNLVENYENRDPFIRALAEGIEELEVRNGEIYLRLAK